MNELGSSSGVGPKHQKLMAFFFFSKLNIAIQSNICGADRHWLPFQIS
jgi:hypothetical protein